MKCEKCGKEIKANDKYYTAVGVVQCEECNTKSNGTVSMDFIFNKMVEDKSNEPIN
jgi:ribosomal protein L37AE/L43A